MNCAFPFTQKRNTMYMWWMRYINKRTLQNCTTLQIVWLLSILHILIIQRLVVRYYFNFPIFWFGVDISYSKIWLVHIGGMCDHLFTPMHCALTVIPIKPDVHDIVTISWKLYLCTSWITCIPSVRCNDVLVHAISINNIYI